MLNSINWYFWFTLFALILSAMSLIVAVETWKKLRYFMVLQASRKHSRQLIPSNRGGKVYVIYNPSKINNLEVLKTKISNMASQTGMEQPTWLSTEINDSGYSMALQAVSDKASLVITAGGDGTVRAVAAGLAGSNIPLALLPVGTGNLLARNLGLSITDLDEAVSVAFTGRNRQIDMGWLHIDDGVYDSSIEPDSSVLRRLMSPNTPDSEEFAFLIMAGIGFDGDMMSSVPNSMKKRFGWFAYVYSALKHLRRKRMGVCLKIGEKDKASHFRARSVLFANCGHLPGNIVLLPDAHIDDGWLELVVIDVKSRVFGWLGLAIKVVLQGVGIKSQMPEIVGKLDVSRTHRAGLVADDYYNVQVDGEYMGKAKQLSVRVQPDALIVRTV